MSRQARVAALCVLLWAAFVYWFTLDDGLRPGELEGGDLITHQYAQVQARPSNAPGYPLYTMGGWLWFHGIHGLLSRLTGGLPNPIPILSSYSTLWALIALWLFYRILLRLSASRDRPEGDWLLAGGLTLFYAATYFFWYYATTTEQYSSAVAQTLAIVYLYLRWQERRTPGLFLGIALLVGLSLAHMVTVGLIGPPLLLALWLEEKGLWRRWRLLLRAAAVGLLPLVSYVYVYVRGAAHPEWWGAGTWDSAGAWFWSFVSTAQGRDEMSWGLQPGAPFFGNGFPELIWQELSLPLLLLGLLGIARLGRRMPVLLYGTLLLYAVFCWVDRFGNWFQVILPAYPLVLMGLLPWAQALTRLSPRRGVGQALLGLLLAAAIVWRVDASWPAVDSRHRPDDTGLDRPALLLDQPLPSGAALFAEKADALGLDYLIHIWGVRPDLRVVSSPEAGVALAEGRPVLAVWTAAPLLLAELPDGPAWRPQSQTPDWVRILPATGDGPPVQPQVLLGQDLGDGIRLLGYTLAPGPTGAPVLENRATDLDVLLFWEVAEQPAQDWWVSLRGLQQGQLLTADNGQPVQQDSPGPVHGLRGFTGLSPGVSLADGYRLPGGVDADGLWIILYRPVADGFENLAEVRLER